MGKFSGKKILVAMSGGVDSSVAVRLLLEQGAEVTGATMRLLPDDTERILKTERLAGKLGVPFCCMDFEKEFKTEIIDAFAKTYIDGRTPNPCVVCNKKFKFGAFFDRAMNRGFDFIATGHYARIEKNESGLFELKRSSDLKKDQSYFLFGLNQAVMSRTVFPLEGCDKDFVRKTALSLGLENALDKDSQDICFVKDGIYTAVVDNYLKERGLDRIPGNFEDSSGRLLGRHGGIERYTIGQRKGVGVSLGEMPMYVISKDPVSHTVIMGGNALLFSDSMTVKNVSFPGRQISCGGERLFVKTRSAQKAVPVFAEMQGDILRAGFESPMRAVTPGQYAVFYDGDTVICGGEIITGQR